MNISVADFPAEVIEQILLFVPTPSALCRVAATCSALSELVSTSERVWDCRYKKRWSHRDSSIVAFSQHHYKVRLLQDKEKLRRLQEVSVAVGRLQEYGLGHEYKSPFK